jgi:hypothetical protein
MWLPVVMSLDIAPSVASRITPSTILLPEQTRTDLDPEVEHYKHVHVGVTQLQTYLVAPRLRPVKVLPACPIADQGPYL